MGIETRGADPKVPKSGVEQMGTPSASSCVSQTPAHRAGADVSVARAQEGSGAVGVWMEAGYERWELSCRGSKPKAQERLLNVLLCPSARRGRQCQLRDVGQGGA